MDEYMHWAPMVKEMFKTNAFYCSKESLLLVHKDYPPFFSLIELLFCFFGRGYFEKYLYIGLVSFALSIILSISFNNKNKLLSIIGLVLIGFIFQYIPSIQDNTSIYNSIYIDYVLSLLFVYVINYLVNNEKYDDFSYKFLVLCFTALLLSKQIGILYFVICILYMLLFTKNMNKKLIISIIMPIIFLVIWKILVKINGVNGQFSLSNFSLRPESISIFKTYLGAVINRPLFIKPFNINLLVIFVVTIIGMLFVDRSSNKKTTIVYGVGFILYYIVIGLLYMFVFSIEEALALSSYERYIISYVYIGISLITINICKKENIIYYLLYFIAVILLCDFNNSNINNIIDKKDILVINQQGENVEFNFNQTTGSIYNFDICDYLYEGEEEKFREIIRDYDYIYVYLYDDYFYRIWVNLLNDKSLENDSLFFIKQRNPLAVENSNFNTIYYVIKYCINENIR